MNLLYDFVTWNGWTMWGTFVLVVCGAIPIMGQPFVLFFTTDWRISQATRSLFYFSCGIALVYVYLVINGILSFIEPGLGETWEGRPFVRFCVFFPFIYGAWRWFFTPLRYRYLARRKARRDEVSS